MPAVGEIIGAERARRDWHRAYGSGGVVMKIVRICAVYKVRPVLLVVQTETGDVLELSLKELKEADYEFDDHAWKQLVEEYQVFYLSSPLR
jgi:hypothetical protein